MKFGLGSLVCLAAVTVGCAPSHALTLEVTDPEGGAIENAVIGQEFLTTVSGLEPSETIDVRIQYNSAIMGKFEAVIPGVANADGIVTISSYDFWQLNPSETFEEDIAENHFRISANDQILDVEEKSFHPNVTLETRDAEADGYAGIWFKADGTDTDKIVVALSGSGGGANRLYAAKLSNEGFTTLALPYFAYEGTPDQLEAIPLEFIEPALREIEEVYPDKEIYVIGPSRGSELSMLLASKYNEIDGAIGIAPSYYVWGANTLNYLKTSAWTWQGEEIPFNKGEGWFDVQEVDGVEVYLNRPVFERGVENVALEDRQVADLTAINGPVLMIGGGDDQVWPACDYIAEAKTILEPLNENSEFICFENAGHTFMLPGMTTTQRAFFHPLMGVHLGMGGTAEASAEMSNVGWEKIISFLSQ